MPTFRAKLSNGVTVELDFDHEPSQQEIRKAALGKAESSKTLQGLVGGQVEAATQGAVERGEGPKSLYPEKEQIAQGSSDFLSRLGITSPGAKGALKGVAQAGVGSVQSLVPVAGGDLLTKFLSNMVSEGLAPTKGEETGHLAGEIGTNVGIGAASIGGGLAGSGAKVLPSLLKGAKIAAAGTAAGAVGAEAGGHYLGTPGRIIGGLGGALLGGKAAIGKGAPAGMTGVAEALPGRVGTLARWLSKLTKQAPGAEGGERATLVRDLTEGRSNMGKMRPEDAATLADQILASKSRVSTQPRTTQGALKAPARPTTTPIQQGAAVSPSTHQGTAKAPAKPSVPEPESAPNQMESLFGQTRAKVNTGATTKPDLMDLAATEKGPSGRLRLPKRPGTSPVEREGISSRGFRSYGYDPKTQILEVEFPDGATYRYHGVTAGDASGIKSAKSRGAALLDITRKYPGTRQGTAAPSIESLFGEARGKVGKPGSQARPEAMVDLPSTKPASTGLAAAAQEAEAAVGGGNLHPEVAAARDSLPLVPKGQTRLYRVEGETAKAAGGAGGKGGGNWYEENLGAYATKDTRPGDVKYVDIPKARLKQLKADPNATEVQLPEGYVAQAKKLGGEAPSELEGLLRQSIEAAKAKKAGGVAKAGPSPKGPAAKAAIPPKGSLRREAKNPLGNEKTRGYGPDEEAAIEAPPDMRLRFPGEIRQGDRVSTPNGDGVVKISTPEGLLIVTGDDGKVFRAAFKTSKRIVEPSRGLTGGGGLSDFADEIRAGLGPGASAEPVRYAKGERSTTARHIADVQKYGVWGRGVKPSKPGVLSTPVDKTPRLAKPKPLEAAVADKNIKSEGGYHYHATNLERAQEIAESGSLKTFKPSHGTDQQAWPDGATTKRAYFSNNASVVGDFAPTEGKSAVLRVKASPGFMRESTGDIYTTKPVSAKDLEILGTDGEWRPLTEFFRQK